MFILWLGIFSVLAGWFYTAGPAAFAYTGLGEIVVFIFMGPVMVLGSYFVMTQEIAPGASSGFGPRGAAGRRHPPRQQHA